MSTTPGKYTAARTWFGTLSKLAGNVTRLFSKADRQSKRARKYLAKAIHSGLLADEAAFELVGDCNAPVVDPSNRDKVLKGWVSFLVETFNEVYTDYVESKNPENPDDPDDPDGDDEE